VAIGLTDRVGRLFGGTYAKGIKQLSHEGESGLVLPHVGAIDQSMTISAFTPQGLIFHVPQSGHVH
jgi:hypothetical protein